MKTAAAPRWWSAAADLQAMNSHCLQDGAENSGHLWQRGKCSCEKYRTQNIMRNSDFKLIEYVPLGTTWSPTVPRLNFPDRIAKILPSFVLM